MNSKRFFVIALVAVAATFATVAGYAAVCNTVVVTNDDVVRLPLNTVPPAGTHWALYTRQSGTGDFVTGPAAPPSGIGSLSLRTPGTPPNGNDKVTLFNYDHVGTPLDSIDGISYFTYRDASSTANPVQAPALNIEVDFNGPAVAGGFTTLVFEPVYNVATQGPVVAGQWQDWDAFDGGNAIWWSTRALPGGICAFDCFVTWNQILAANPDATIVGGFGVNQGGGNDGLIANVDALKLSTADDCVVYDFEPFRVATTKDACKAGGWRSVKRADGSPFRNQGDCVSYVSSGK